MFVQRIQSTATFVDPTVQETCGGVLRWCAFNEFRTRGTAKCFAQCAAYVLDGANATRKRDRDRSVGAPRVHLLGFTQRGIWKELIRFRHFGVDPLHFEHLRPPMARPVCIGNEVGICGQAAPASAGLCYGNPRNDARTEAITIQRLQLRRQVFVHAGR